MMKLLFVLGVLLSLGMVSSCSSDDEIGSSHSNSDLKSNVDSISEIIQISFSLLNEKDIPTSSFKYGEDICFELIITNNSNKALFFFDDIFLGDDLFRVYLEDGTDMGTPWTSIGTEFVAVGIEPKASMHRTCRWIGMRADKPIEKDRELAPLPKGNYYTNFSIKYRNFDNIKTDMFIEKMYNCKFTIQ